MEETLFLGRVAAHKVRYRVRHLGGVFTFCVARDRILIFAEGQGGLMARAAPDFFKIFRLLDLKSQNFARPQVRLAITGPAWAPSSLILGRILVS